MKQTLHGLDMQIERCQAWRDASKTLPVVRVIDDTVCVYASPQNGGQLLISLPSVELYGFIQRLEYAQQALRVRTASWITGMP